MASLSVPGNSTVHPSKTTNSIRPGNPAVRSRKRFSSASLQGPRFIQGGAQRPREVRARLFWEGWFRDSQNGSVPKAVVDDASTETTTAPISTPGMFKPRSPTVVNGGPPPGFDGSDNWQQLTTAPSIGKLEFVASQWRVRKKLGQGSYGVVYLAEDLDDGEARRAVKVLSKSRAKVDPRKVLWKLDNEATLLSALQDCPNVVKMHHVLEDKERIYLVMDECSGGSLQDLLDKRKGSLSEPEAALVMADVLRFMEACHKHQICYADTKTTNFMFGSDYLGLQNLEPNQGGVGLKAIDMGCSKVVRSGTMLTKRLGTPAYFAPEVFLRNFNSSADMWSSGILAYQLLTGRFPWWPTLKNLTTTEVMESVVHKKVPYDKKVWSRFSPEAQDFTMSLLRRQSGRRLSASEALQHPWIQTNLEKYNQHLDF